MRKFGWALIGISALTAFGLQTAEAGVTCKMIPSFCPRDDRKTDESKTDERKGTDAPTAVPEPATLMLLAGGVSAVGAAALRRRKNKKDK
jgi:PEP-CTERM motif